MGVMYGNALILIGIGVFQTKLGARPHHHGGHHAFFHSGDRADFLLPETFPGAPLVSPDLLAEHVPGAVLCCAIRFCDPREESTAGGCLSRFR